MIETIKLESDKYYEVKFPLLGEIRSVHASGVALCELIYQGFDKPIPDRYSQQLKELHIALSRAIEEGDNLKLGIVLGQSISKLEQIIND